MQKLTSTSFVTVRQTFKMKCLRGRIDSGMGHSLCRFAEFVITYFTKDGENLFTAFEVCASVPVD
jgi:hypothetical protein